MSKGFMTNSDVKSRQQWEVIKRTRRTDVTGVKLGDRKFKFGQGDMFVVDDPAIAKDLHQTVGQEGSDDVIVVPVEKSAGGRRRTWTVPALPWHEEK